MFIFMFETVTSISVSELGPSSGKPVLVTLMSSV